MQLLQSILGELRYTRKDYRGTSKYFEQVAQYPRWVPVIYIKQNDSNTAKNVSIGQLHYTARINLSLHIQISYRSEAKILKLDCSTAD